MKTALLSILLMIGFLVKLNAQNSWASIELNSVPMRIANNALAKATAGGNTYVYSFGGIDSTKLFSGITRKSFRYDLTNDNWQSIDPLPDTLGKIASAASTVKNKIYIIGGYHVFANGNEISSDRVHIFDPDLNVFLADGAKVPVPIDDHVQAVWRDGLIYVVTGWSQSTNVANVQIYNPAIDSWMVGTPVPALGNYKVFGASGAIIDDTIFYAGGARMGTFFPLVDQLRKGVIDPANPTQISWTTQQDSNALGYRMGATHNSTKVIWFGGSTTSYNFDGIAYNGSGGVSPSRNILVFDVTNQILFCNKSQFERIMDMRGAVHLENDLYLVAGGMDDGQQVSNKTHRMVEVTPGIAEHNVHFQIYPNPFEDAIFVQVSGDQSKVIRISLFSLSGKLLLQEKVGERGIIDTADLPNGLFIIVVEMGGAQYIRKGIKYPR